MHDRQNGVAGFYVSNNYTKCTHIMQARKINILALHLAPDAEEMLGAPIHFRLNIRSR